jgi:hypothetical protein
MTFVKLKQNDEQIGFGLLANLLSESTEKFVEI